MKRVLIKSAIIILSVVFAFFSFGGASNVVSKQRVLRSQSRTEILNNTEDRVFNIKKALSVINGLRLMPEYSYSFNELTGDRSKNNGYKDSIIIKDKEFTLGSGGGVCQVSSTLYNALILSDVTINEVHNHSIKPSYVALSFDAMVNYPNFDLKFTNNTGSVLLIKAFIQGNFVVVKIYGESMDIEIERETVILKEYTPKTEVIYDKEDKYSDLVNPENPSYFLKKPITGYKTQGYLIYKSNGRRISRTLIRTNWYMAVDGKELRYFERQQSFLN